MKTTVIGSYPLNHSELGPEAVRQVVEEQISAGIGLISDGQTRADMVSVYAGVLKGTQLKARKGAEAEGGGKGGNSQISEGDRKLHITGKLEAGDPSIFVEDYLVAREAASGRAEVKACITGPATLVFSSILETKHYKGYRDISLYMDAAAALLSIAKALEKAGATKFQLDEPFFSVGVPVDIAQEAVESISKGLKGELALHVCGDVSKVFDRLLTFKGIGLLSHGFAGTRSNFELVSKEKLEKAGKVLGFGCVDTSSERVESEKEVLDLLRKGISKFGKENMVAHPDCGLRPLPLDIARAKLRTLGSAVRHL